MNDKFTQNDRDEQFAQKLNQIAEQANVNSQFAAELEERLRNAHQPKAGWLAASFKQVSPVLRWVALMVLLGLVLSLSIKTLIPAPQPGVNDTPAVPEITTLTPQAITTATPVTQGEGYDWQGRNSKLYMAAPLPEGPAEANVYLLRPDQPATVEEARALAGQFGIQGEIYQAPGELPDTTGYMITDGKQRLYVRSKNYFTYYADYSLSVSLLGIKEISEEEARAVIDSFLRSRGFEFEYQLEKEAQTPGIYYVLLLTPDGYGIRFDYNMPSRLQVTIGSDGQVISVDSSQIEYETVGSFGIRSAEEAFQQVLGSAVSDGGGVMESARSGGVLNESYWERAYPEDQTVTLYGRVTVFNPVDPGKPAFTALNNYTVTGNTPPASSDQLIEAVGQFYTENGIRKFNVESWQPSTALETSVMGTLQREGEQIVLLSDTGDQYVIPDVPADVPRNTVPPDEQLLVNGVLADGNLVWTSIQYFPEGSNFGGGGGGGTGFHQLNLSGTPVPFTTTQPESNQGTAEYIVKEGDTCGGIAIQFGVSVQSIVTFNNLPENCVISVGQTLQIPSATPTPSADGSSEAIPTSQASPATTEYIVQENDTAASIAMSFGISVEELSQANDLGSNNMVYVGQKLFIPGQQTDNPLVGKRFEGQRGNLTITLYEQPDGSQREEFGFLIKNEDGFVYARLEDVTFEALLAYHNRPLDIWGTVKYVDQIGTPVVAVEKYEAPYPGLSFQLIQGTQKSVEIDGMPAILFTTDAGKSYVQMTQDGLVNMGLVGEIGDPVYAEALLIPDETFGGYPGMRIFNMGMAVNPKNGEPATITITADQPHVMEAALDPANYVPPDAIIEKVELAYHIPDPRYVPPDPNAGPQYIQPVWRFSGHYSNGDVFEVLVQALKQEYLLPELEGFTPPG